MANAQRIPPNLRAVVENLTVADLGSRLSDDIAALADDPEAWVTRQR